MFVSKIYGVVVLVTSTVVIVAVVVDAEVTPKIVLLCYIVLLIFNVLHKNIIKFSERMDLKT